MSLDGPTGARRTAWLVLALIALGYLPAVTTAMNSDIAWLLYTAESWLEGAELYVDLLETNPPLVVWIYAPAVWLGRLLSVSSYAAFLVWTGALLAGALALAHHLASRLGLVRGASVRRWLLVLFVFGAFVLAGRGFGQKDHLAAVLMLPYVLALVARTEGGEVPRGGAVAAGGAAAFAVALKPHFLLVPLFLELLRNVVSRRWGGWWRTETVALAGGFLAYLLAVLAAAPAYLAVVGRYGSLYTGHAQLGLAELVTHPASLVLAIGWTLFALTEGPPRRRLPTAAFLTAGSAFLVAAAVQLKGWSYHFLPALMMGTWALGLGAFLEARSKKLGPYMRSVAAGVLLLLVGFSVWSVATLALRESEEEARLERVTALLDECGSDDVLAVLSPTIRSSFPLVNRTGMEWGLRHHSQWALTVYTDLERRHGEESSSQRLRRARERWLESRSQTVEDLRTRPPAYLLLDGRASERILGEQGPDLLGLYRDVPEFRALLSKYETERGVAGYRVWRRNRPEIVADACSSVAGRG